MILMFEFFLSILEKIGAFFTSILVMLGILTGSSANQKLFMELPVVETCRSVQGGCSDGTYMYIAMWNPTAEQVPNPDYKPDAVPAVPEFLTKNACRVLKIDPVSKTTVQTSDVLYVDHANDITYNSVNNELIICNNDPNYTTISILDPATLTVITTEKVSRKIYSIVYVGDSDCYYAGISGGYNIVKFSRNFEELGTVSLVSLDSSKFTRQGITYYNNSIYCVYSGENSVYKYSPDGKLEGKLTLPEKNYEPENIFFHNGVMYIGYEYSGAAKGGAIYSVTDIKWEE